MAKESSHLNAKEHLKAENDFLKMKLMLENGAEFGGGGDDKDMDPMVENMFLRNVAEFEKQSAQKKMIRVFDKIGRPAQFRPVTEIPDDEIETAWKELSVLLFRHNISVGVYSPNISLRELYRFVTEELFKHLMDDIDVPGIIHGFIYDEFHPDPVYDNTRLAVEDCISYILRKQPMELIYPFRSRQLRLNALYPLTTEELQNVVNKFKTKYDDLELKSITDIKCIVNKKESQVKGDYLLTVKTGIETYDLAGNWKVILEPDPGIGYWYITEIHIDKIDF